MTPDSFEDIASRLVAESRDRAQFQARDIAERLARGRVEFTLPEARAAMRARDALIRELMK